MMLVFSDVIKEFIYNGKQQNISNCYTYQTTVTYNKNIQQIIVDLVTANNDDCFLFPKGVEAQLTFQIANIPIQRIQLTDFGYNKTKQLIFNGVPTIKGEQFIILHIYSYALITELPIYIFKEQRSSLDDCFKNTSIITISDGKLIISMTPTLLCTNQFNIEESADTPPIIISQMVEVAANIQGYLFDLNVDYFVANYKLGKTLKQTIILTKNQTSELLLLIAPNATITFKTQQINSFVQFQHNIGQIKSTGWGSLFTSFWDPYLSSQIGLYNNIHYLKLHFNSNLEPLFDQINATKFDNIMYQISGVQGTKILLIQQTIFTTTFDSKIRVLTYQCDQDQEITRKNCKAFYENAKNKTIKTAYYVDLIFQLGSAVVHIEKQVLTQQVKQIDLAVLKKGHNTCQLQIIGDHELTQFKPNKVLNFTIIILQNSNPVSFSDESISFNVQVYVNSIADKVEFPCDEKCEKLLQKVQNEKQVYYAIQLTGVPIYVFGHSVAHSDYRVVIGLVCAVGCVIICVLVVISVIEVVLLIKQIKKQKKMYKNRHKK